MFDLHKLDYKHYKASFWVINFVFDLVPNRKMERKRCLLRRFFPSMRTKLREEKEKNLMKVWQKNVLFLFPSTNIKKKGLLLLQKIVSFINVIFHLECSFCDKNNGGAMNSEMLTIGPLFQQAWSEVGEWRYLYFLSIKKRHLICS